MYSIDLFALYKYIYILCNLNWSHCPKNNNLWRSNYFIFIKISISELDM